MKRDVMNAKIKEELDRIPKDIKGSSQMILRMAYRVARSARMDQPKEVALKSAIEAVKKQDPNFEPKYDREYFKV